MKNPEIGKEEISRDHVRSSDACSQENRPTRFYEVIKKNGGERKIRITLVPEHFRTLFYCEFLALVLFGMFLTLMFAKEKDTTQIITDVFGASNICTYFDFPPASYILPVCWIFPMLCAIAYDVISMFRIWIAFEEQEGVREIKNLQDESIGIRPLGKKTVIFLILAHIYFIATVILFTMIFAVTPDRDNPESMLWHSVPYLNLKVAMFVLQVAVVLFGQEIAWKKLHDDKKLPRYFIEISWLHVILQGITMVISGVVIFNALDDMGIRRLQGKGIWWDVHNDDNLKLVSEIFGNYLSFFLNIIFPMVQSIYLSRKGHQKMSNTHCVIFSISDNREGKAE